jgi:hypothetical protein
VLGVNVITHYAIQAVAYILERVNKQLDLVSILATLTYYLK